MTRIGSGAPSTVAPPTRRRLLSRPARVAGAVLAAAPLWGGCASWERTALPEGAARSGLSGNVELWQIYTGSPAVPRVRELFARKLRPLDAQIVDVPGAEMVQKLTVSAAGGTPPDAVFINAPWFRDCARFFQPLDALLKRDARQIDADDFLPVGLQAATIKGQTYGLPLEVAVRVWWFNRDTLAEQGVASPVRAGAPPKVDYRQVEEMAQRLTFMRGDQQVYGMYVQQTWFNVLIYVHGFGGRFLDEGHTRCLLDSPRATAGIEYAFDLINRRRIAPATLTLDAHEQGNAIAMNLDNAARAQNLRKVPNGAAWDTGPVVQGPAAPMTFAFVHHAGIVSGTKNPDGAWAAIGEFTGKDVTRLWMEGHGWPTVRKSYLDTWIKEGQPPPETRQNVLEWLKVSPLVTFPAGYSANVMPVAQRLVNEAIAGQRSVRDTTAALGREITPLLERT